MPSYSITQNTKDFEPYDHKNFTQNFMNTTRKILQRKLCCCCVNHISALKKSFDPDIDNTTVITTQPTRLNAAELHEGGAANGASAKSKSQQQNGSVVKNTMQTKASNDEHLDFDEIDLNNDTVSYHVPKNNVQSNSEKVKKTFNPLSISSTSTSRSQNDLSSTSGEQTNRNVATAVTDMMLNEIYEKLEPLEDEESIAIEEAPADIDLSVVSEATDEEIQKSALDSQRSSAYNKNESTVPIDPNPINVVEKLDLNQSTDISAPTSTNTNSHAEDISIKENVIKHDNTKLAPEPRSPQKPPRTSLSFHDAFQAKNSITSELSFSLNEEPNEIDSKINLEKEKIIDATQNVNQTEQNGEDKKLISENMSSNSEKHEQSSDSGMNRSFLVKKSSTLTTQKIDSMDNPEEIKNPLHTDQPSGSTVSITSSKMYGGLQDSTDSEEEETVDPETSSVSSRELVSKAETFINHKNTVKNLKTYEKLDETDISEQTT